MNIIEKITALLSLFMLTACMLAPLRRSSAAQKHPWIRRFVGFHTFYGITLLVTGLIHGLLAGGGYDDRQARLDAASVPHTSRPSQKTDEAKHLETNASHPCSLRLCACGDTYSPGCSLPLFTVIIKPMKKLQEMSGLP